MTPKERLYYLIKNVMLNKYDINTFCDLFTDIYNTEVDKNVLSPIELNVFSNLEKYTCRFSNIMEDLKIPNAYFDDIIIRREVEHAVSILNIELN